MKETGRNEGRTQEMSPALSWAYHGEAVCAESVVWPVTSPLLMAPSFGAKLRFPQNTLGDCVQWSPWAWQVALGSLLRIVFQPLICGVHSEAEEWTFCWPQTGSVFGLDRSRTLKVADRKEA